MKPKKPEIDIRPEVGGFVGVSFFWLVVVGLLFLTCVEG